MMNFLFDHFGKHRKSVCIFPNKIWEALAATSPEKKGGMLKIMAGIHQKNTILGLLALTFQGCKRFLLYVHAASYVRSGQIIATSHDLTSKGSWGREIPLFQGNLGWWNNVIWPDKIGYSILEISTMSQHEWQEAWRGRWQCMSQGAWGEERGFYRWTALIIPVHGEMWVIKKNSWGGWNTHTSFRILIWCRCQRR